MLRKLSKNKNVTIIITTIINNNKNKDSAHQVEHAAQHGQKQEGSLSTDIVDGANYCRTRGWHSKDEGPD